MSGGHWNYMNDSLVYEIFGDGVLTRDGFSGEDHERNIKAAIKARPLRDPEISALVLDVFYLLASYDLAASGDTDISDYMRDVAIFKERWFKKPRKEQIRNIIDMSTLGLKEDLYQAFLGDTDQAE